MKINNCIRCGNNKIEVKWNGIIKCECGNIVCSFSAKRNYIEDWNYSNPAPKKYIKGLEEEIEYWKKIIQKKRKEINRVKRMVKR